MYYFFNADPINGSLTTGVEFETYKWKSRIKVKYVCSILTLDQYLKYTQLAIVL